MRRAEEIEESEAEKLRSLRKRRSREEDSVETEDRGVERFARNHRIHPKLGFAHVRQNDAVFANRFGSVYEGRNRNRNQIVAVRLGFGFFSIRFLSVAVRYFSVRLAVFGFTNPPLIFPIISLLFFKQLIIIKKSSHVTM